MNKSNFTSFIVLTTCIGCNTKLTQLQGVIWAAKQTKLLSEHMSYYLSICQRLKNNPRTDWDINTIFYRIFYIYLNFVKLFIYFVFMLFIWNAQNLVNSCFYTNILETVHPPRPLLLIVNIIFLLWEYTKPSRSVGKE